MLIYLRDESSKSTLHSCKRRFKCKGKRIFSISTSHGCGDLCDDGSHELLLIEGVLQQAYGSGEMQWREKAAELRKASALCES